MAQGVSKFQRDSALVLALTGLIFATLGVGLYLMRESRWFAVGGLTLGTPFLIACIGLLRGRQWARMLAFVFFLLSSLVLAFGALVHVMKGRVAFAGSSIAFALFCGIYAIRMATLTMEGDRTERKRHVSKKSRELMENRPKGDEQKRDKEGAVHCLTCSATYTPPEGLHMIRCQQCGSVIEIF